MKSIFIFIVVILWNVYLTFIYDSPIWVTLLLFEIAFLVAGIIQVVTIRRKLTISCFTTLPVAEINSNIGFDLEVTNSSMFPIIYTNIIIKYTNVFTGKVKRIKQGCHVAAHSKATIHFDMVSENCGVIKIDIDKFPVTDAAGFISIGKNFRIDNDVMVLPKLIKMQLDIEPQLLNFQGDSNEFDKNRPGDDVSEVFRIREYREGDRMQNVHWKVSAKGDELMIKEYSRPIACSLIILANLQNESDSVWKNADKYITILLSYSLMLVEKGCYHYVAWYDKKTESMVRRAVYTGDDVYLLMNEIMRSTPYVEDYDIQQMYRSEFPHDIFLKMYHFSMDMKMREGGVELWDAESFLKM